MNHPTSALHKCQGTQRRSQEMRLSHVDGAKASVHHPKCLPAMQAKTGWTEGEIGRVFSETPQTRNGAGLETSSRASPLFSLDVGTFAFSGSTRPQGHTSTFRPRTDGRSARPSTPSTAVSA